MKNIIYLFACLFILGGSSCKSGKITTSHDNGKHKGWYKNTNNPHNPAHKTKTKAGNGSASPGKVKGKK